MFFNPLNLDNETAYQKWRVKKILAYENNESLVPIEINQALALSNNEIDQMLKRCNIFNYTIYRLTNPQQSTKQFVVELGKALGLERLNGNLCSDSDNISSIQVKEREGKTLYIPYTSKRLTWHTDGYYNKSSETIRGMILHCVQPAQSGGENLMLDHEMAYIQLRDENPQFISAFMQPDVLTIPPNIENDIELRAAQSGPVFSLNQQDKTLHMRFSARTQNIQWKNNALTLEAIDCMNGLLKHNNPYVITYRMQAGEGIIANNVLHNRTAFTDSDDKRLLYRARYYDRIKSLVVSRDFLLRVNSNDIFE